MGIKCSLLGHDFDDATVERDREEQGSEVVITIREVETCARCGETKVVSENKEVTTLETPEDIDAPAPSDQNETDDTEADDAELVEEDDEAEDSDVGAGEPSPVVEAEPEPDSAEIVEEAEPDDSEPETPTVETETEPPVTDDAEILDDDDDDTPERQPGEWPQEADEETSHDEEDFDQYGYMDDEEESDDADNRDAEFIDDGTDADTDTEDVEPVQATNAWPSEEDADAGTDSTPSGPGAVTVPDGEFVCQACGFSTPVESSSLREGDFCPECHKDTLVQMREQ